MPPAMGAVLMVVVMVVSTAAAVFTVASMAQVGFVAELADFTGAFAAESTADLGLGPIPAARISVGHSIMRYLVAITPILATSILTQSTEAPIRLDLLPLRMPHTGIIATILRVITLT